MITFNIFKPDLLGKDEEEREYLETVRSQIGTIPSMIFRIPDWSKVSKTIYEQDLLNTKLSCEATREKRKQILRSVIAYEEYYKDSYGRLLLFNINGSYQDLEEKLRIFNRIKKEFRKKYVYTQDKYFVKFVNEREIDFDAPLHSIDHSSIIPETKIVRFDEEVNEPGFELAFFNKIHCPDPLPTLVEHELKLIGDCGVLTTNNLLLERKVS